MDRIYYVSLISGRDRNITIYCMSRVKHTTIMEILSEGKSENKIKFKKIIEGGKAGSEEDMNPAERTFMEMFFTSPTPSCNKRVSLAY